MQHLSFESVGAVIEAAKTTVLSPTDDCIGVPEWLGRNLNTWDEILYACQSPWAEGANVVKRLVEHLEVQLPVPKSRKRKSRWSEDHGDEVSYERLYEGNPYWRQYVKEMTEGSGSVVIAVGVGASYKTPWEELRWKGIAAVALTDTLEKAGYRVELVGAYAGLCYKKNNAPMSISFKVKETNAPVDVDSMATAVSTFFFRSTLIQLIKLIIGTRSGTLVMPITGWLDHLAGTDSNLIYVDDVSSEGQALEFVRKELEKLSLPLAV